MNQTVASLADAVRLGVELGQALHGASGFKATLRRFAELLGTNFGVRIAGFARISGRGRKLTLKRRTIRVAGLDLIADEALATVAHTLMESDGRIAELRDG